MYWRWYLVLSSVQEEKLYRYIFKSSQTMNDNSSNSLNLDAPETVNESRLSQAIADTGNFSFGVSAIEIWILNEKKTRLFRPQGAWWRDPDYQPPDNIDQESCREALMRLEDPTHEGYLEPQPLQPGVGIAGRLLAEKTTKARAPGHTISAFGSFRGLGSRRRGSEGSMPSISLNQNVEKRFSLTGLDKVNMSLVDETLIWRGLHFMACDPDQIPDNRLDTFLEAGFGLVAGCPFDLKFIKGIVLYYAKAGVEKSLLEEGRNDDFLQRSVRLMVSVLALSESRVNSWENKQEEIALLQRKQGQLTVLPQSDELIQVKPEAALSDLTRNQLGESFTLKSSPSSYFGVMLEKIIMMKNKIFDDNQSAQGPPPMPTTECMWTFVGSFLTLFAVSYTSQSLDFWTEKKYAIPLGPIGALTTLLFGLTSAPASQPKNALYGPIIAGTSGLVLSYIPPYLFNLRLALSASISITMMAKLGVLHPPAGALAVMLVLDDEFHWGSLLQYVIGVVIAIGIATVVNNLNEKRTYPQYWNMLHSSFRKK